MRRGPEGGFTLIEALVTLAITAAALAAIGQLGYTTYAAARRAETRLVLTATARKAYAALTGGAAFGDGARTGAMDGADWRVVTAPFPFQPQGAPPNPPFLPEAERLIVTSPGGGRVVVDTVRLRATGARR